MTQSWICYRFVYTMKEVGEIMPLDEKSKWNGFKYFMLSANDIGENGYFYNDNTRMTYKVNRKWTDKYFNVELVDGHFKIRKIKDNPEYALIKYKCKGNIKKVLKDIDSIYQHLEMYKPFG